MELNPGGVNPYAAEMAYYRSGSSLFGTLGNRFIGTKVGSSISTGLGSALGKIGIGSGAALSGAATLATTLGGITAAAGVAYIAIKKLYDASPAGQVKIAEKYLLPKTLASFISKYNWSRVLPYSSALMKMGK